jgi:hypothetical protein
MSDEKKQDNQNTKDNHLDPWFVEFKQKTKLHKLYDRLSQDERAWSDKVLNDLSSNLRASLDIITQALNDPEQRKEILKKMGREDDVGSENGNR